MLKLKERNSRYRQVDHITPNEFAKEAGFAPSTVRRWLQESYINGVKRGQRKWFIPVTELARILNLDELDL